MFGHGAGIGYTGPGPRMGPIDNFSLVTGPAATPSLPPTATTYVTSSLRRNEVPPSVTAVSK